MKLNSILLGVILHMAVLLTFQNLTAQEAFVRQDVKGDRYVIDDFNSDGNQDLFVTRYTSFGDSDLFLLINQCEPGQAVFDSIFISEVNDFKGKPSTGDFDFDGDIDIIYQRGDSVDMYLLVNDGNMGFEEIDLGLAHAFNNQILDVDADGDMDIMGYSGSKGEFYLFVNEGNNDFTTLRPLEDDTYLESMIAHDVEGDGDLDLVIGMRSWDDRQLVFLINEGNLNFTEVNKELEFSSSDVGELKTYDYNEDGLDDLFYIDGTRLAGLINQGNGEYSEFKLLPQDGADYYPMVQYAFGDMDDDGWVDIVTGGANIFDPYFAKLFLNDATDPVDPAFVEIEIGGYTPGWNVDLADLDCDGDLDVINGHSSGFAFFLNQVERYIPTNDIPLSSFRFYPNPASSNIVIDTDGIDLLSVSVFDAMGQLLDKHSAVTCSFSVEHLSPGMYFVLLETREGISRASFVKE